MTNEIIGWIGAALFAICALPQAVKTFKTKQAGDLSWMFLLFWLFGEIFTFIYVIIDDIKLKTTHYPLYINYVVNIVLVFYLLYAKMFYGKTKKNKKVELSYSAVQGENKTII